MRGVRTVPGHCRKAPRYHCSSQARQAGQHRAHRQCPLAGGDTRQIFACHCEERSDGTIRSPAVAQSKEQRLRRIRESAYGFARSSTGLPGFPAGRTDCHTSAIQATHPSPWLFRRKSQVLSRSTASPSPGRTGAPRFHLALARNDKFGKCAHGRGRV